MLAVCLLGCAPGAAGPVGLLTGTRGCYLTMFPIFGTLLSDPVYGATLDGAPIVWPEGSTAVSLAGGRVEVRVPGQGPAGGDFVATSGREYWVGNGPDPRREGAVAAFAACTIADASPERLRAGGTSFAAQRAGGWLQTQKQALVLRNIEMVWCDTTPQPDWCEWVRRQDGGPVVARIEDGSLIVGVRNGTPAEVAEQLCRDVAADDNALPDGWVGSRNRNQGVYASVNVQAGPDGSVTTPTGIEWTFDGVKLAECAVPPGASPSA